MRIIYFLVLASAAVSHAFASDFVDEKTLMFTVKQEKLTSGSVQFASSLAAPADAAKFWPAEIDPKDFLKSGSGKVLLVKAAYLVSKSSPQLSEPGFFDTRNFSKILPQLEIVRELSSGQAVVQSPLPPVPFGMLPSHIQCTLEFHQSSHPNAMSSDAGLGAPLIRTDQTCVDFNLLFDGSSNVSYFYPVDAKSTVVINYQTYLVRDSAFEKASAIPFFNLRKKLEGQIKEELKLFIKSMNSP
jgi:hypothetical protein